MNTIVLLYANLKNKKIETMSDFKLKYYILYYIYYILKFYFLLFTHSLTLSHSLTLNMTFSNYSKTQ